MSSDSGDALACSTAAHLVVAGSLELGHSICRFMWLRVAWEFADPYVRAICEKMKGLEEYPGYGFAVQIDVTVGNALLIEWAARDKKQSTAVRVLHQPHYR